MTTKLERLLHENPNINLWEYIQERPEESEDLFGLEANTLFELIEQAQSFSGKTGLNVCIGEVSMLSEEEQIFLSFLCLKKCFPLDLLKKTFGLNAHRISLVLDFWKEAVLFAFRGILDNSAEFDIANDLLNDKASPHKYSLNSPSEGRFISNCENIIVTGNANLFTGNAKFIGNANSVIGNANSVNWQVQTKQGFDVPVSLSQEPLPHSGLFIRRNNQFGTRLAVGIKDLINKGTLIDQTNIRFDDFIAPNSEEIQPPNDGSSIGVSYGITSIPLSQKRDDRATHYLEIALKSSNATPVDQPKNPAPPVNYVFVVDTSGSMSGQKLDSVKESIWELFVAMKPNDVIGIVEFNTNVNTAFKAKTKATIAEAEFSQAVSSLHATGGTDINLGIQYGIDEISRYEDKKRLNHIYLFSDGNSNSGETSWIRIRQNLDAKTRGKIRLSTFAFGSDANKRELDALAGLTGGKSTFVTDVDDIKANLQEELSRREHLAGINIQIKVEIDEDISILYLYGHDEIKDPARRAAVLRDAEQAKEKAQQEFGVESAPDLITQEDGIRIFVPDLAVGETYWVVFELGILAEKAQNPVGKATVQYVDTFAQSNRSHSVVLTSPGVIDSELVTQHALGLWSSEIAFYTLDDLYEKDYQTAKDRILNHVNLLSAANDELQSDFIRDDIVIFQKFMSLSQNLGKMLRPSEPTSFSSGFRSDGMSVVPVYFTCTLNEYGRVKNGFQRMTL